ncbi:hypothetical protein DDE82_007699 [Stemphylium lycopersici]|nr:hypothetical protein DDE82_007699 [Stemphylium lycopersici]
MSSGGAFWAAANRAVKSSTSPTPNIAEVLPKPKPATEPQQKKAMVLKSMTNGNSSNAVSSMNFTSHSISSGKKLDWDDEEEDNSFLAQFTDQKQQPINTAQETAMVVKEERIKELEETVIARAIRIVELEEIIETKVTRIAELERVVEGKDHEIDDLEVNVQEKEIHIEELKKENYTQFIEIQDLHHEMNEKDDRVERLEAELNQKDATIRAREQESVLSTQPSTDNSEVMSVDVKDPSNTFLEDAGKGTDGSETEMTESTTNAPASESFEMVDPPKSSYVQSVPTPENTQTGAPKDTTVTKTARGPSFGSSDFPTFSTKETLKVVPPAPKPKKLSFPMDMSKYGKKAPPVAKQLHASSAAATKGGTSILWDQSSKQARVKTNAQPIFNPSKDIRHMPHGERVLYANSPDVVVKLGDVKLMTIPKYVLMQCSAKAMQYFTANPDATSWVFSAGSMDAESAKAHLNWMNEMTYQGRVYSLTLNTAPAHDLKNLRICRAARVLGLNNAYIGHFTKQLCERIRNRDVSHEFKDAVCELAYPDNDPIFDCLANNLVTLKKNRNATDAEGLKKLVAKQPLLKTKMEHIEKRIGGGRARKSPAGSERGGSKARDAKADAAKGRGSSAAAVPGYNPVDTKPGSTH